MTTDDLLRLYAYSRWATQRLLRAAAQLEQPALDTPLGTSFGTLRGTISHLYGVERMWLDRWNGGNPGAPQTLEIEPVEVTEQRWTAVWNGQEAFVRKQGPAELSGAFAYRRQNGSPASVGMEDMLIHVANHATYHRGQIAAGLRQVGGTPVATDYLLFASR